MTESDGNTPIKAGDAVRYVKDGKTGATVYVVTDVRATGWATFRTTGRYLKPTEHSTPLEKLEKVCGEGVWSNYEHHACGRRLKGQDLCGLHLSAKLRREAKEAARKADNQAAQSAVREMQARIDAYDLTSIVQIHNVLKGTVLINLDDLIMNLKDAS